ncbi:hypothetical protein PR202_ga17697 [Eleusine coracana subsp. coracana]|uniref:Uncharacterized protein n=1 Tax=Eleusine coracana subsp. coracana TaxID=191504 RepID=A0AAV5CQG7_ELECO|nr:hypothetical protein PR202_ga17450 [Eleusine coracana subsp. coracana]GJN00508.1 hypothetical protein PR202_ga17697 [Eleusine coracana subsp. coracana]
MDEGDDVFLQVTVMDATAFAHATSSRFIRFSSLQIIGSTGRLSLSAARNTGAAAPPETSSSPLPGGNARRTVSAPRAIGRYDPRSIQLASEF